MAGACGASGQGIEALRARDYIITIMVEMEEMLDTLINNITFLLQLISIKNLFL